MKPSLLTEKHLYLPDTQKTKGSETAFLLARKIEHPLGLAPMAGISDLAFREICYKLGVGFTTTELVSAKGIKYSGLEPAWKYIALGENEKATGIQLFGEDAEDFGFALEKILAEESLKKMFVLDINMGCPVPKVCKTGAGAALMKTPEKAMEIVKVCRKFCEPLGIPVTVKFRKGYQENDCTCVEFALAMAEAGAAALTLHARTRAQMYAGHADWDCIQKTKKALVAWEKEHKHPGICFWGNGDIVDGKTAKKMLLETEVDGIQVGRAAKANPWIFEEITHYLQEKTFTPPTFTEKLNQAKEHFEVLLHTKGERLACLEFRKTFAWYLQGLKGVGALRNTVMQIEKAKDFYEIFETLQKAQL